MLKQSALFKVPPRMYQNAAQVIPGAMAAHIIPNIEAVIEVMKEGSESEPKEIAEMERYLAELKGINKYPLTFTMPVDLSDWAYDAVLQASKIGAAERLRDRNLAILQDIVEVATQGRWGELGPLIDADNTSYEVSIGQDTANNIVIINIVNEKTQSSRTITVPRDASQIHDAIDVNQKFTKSIIDMADLSNTDHAREIGWGVLDVHLIPSPADKPNAGLWKVQEKRIEIYFTEDLYSKSDFNFEMNESLDTLRHELQHALQFMSRDLTFNSVEFGKGPSGHKSTHQNPNLHDIEYQPRLQDSIEYFTRYMKRLDSSLFSRAVQIWTGARNEKIFPFPIYDNAIEIGTHIYSLDEVEMMNDFIREQPFFKDLKGHAPERWRSAFSTFYAQAYAMLFPYQQ